MKTCLNFSCPERKCRKCGLREESHPLDGCKKFEGGECTAGEYELGHCKVCNQMTNHLDGECQKHKSSIDKILKEFDELNIIVSGAKVFADVEKVKELKLMLPIAWDLFKPDVRRFLLSSLQSYGKEQFELGKDKRGKCYTCGIPLSTDCAKCQHDWEN